CLSSTHGELVGLSLAIGPNQACYIPLAHENEPSATGGGLFGDEPSEAAPVIQIDRAEALEALKPLLENPAVLKVMQNGKYDITVMANYGITVGPIDDTLLLSYVLGGGLHAHGMDEQARRLLGHECIPFKQVAGTGKSQKSFKHVELKAATEYAAEDADVTLRLWQILKPQLAEQGLLTVYETLERPMP